MNDPIEQKVNEWERVLGPPIREVNLQIIHLSKRLFNDYELYIGPSPTFRDRLAQWLQNVKATKDQKSLFQLIPHIFYIGKEEFNVLYREAYNTIYFRWLTDLLKINFLNEEENARLIKEALSHTWFCPLTDSLRINQFYHINNIPAQNDHRPDWRSLRQFGSVEKIKNYILENEIKYLVLLEDFVGNGGQVSKTVEFVAKNFPQIPTLVIPLIICPAGLKVSQDFEKQQKVVSIRPVISLPKSWFLTKSVTKDEPKLFDEIRRLSIKNYSKVCGGVVPKSGMEPYSPLGYKQTGGLIVMYTNTPNNTLPIIHRQSELWFPIFLRHKRV
jgi:hypothetical protein